MATKGRRHRQSLAARDGWRCSYCTMPGTIDTLVSDHILPESRGGPNDLWNRVLACVDCDGDKRNRTPAEWAEDRGEPGKVWGTPALDDWGKHNQPPSETPPRPRGSRKTRMEDLLRQGDIDELERLRRHMETRGRKKPRGSKLPGPSYAENLAAALRQPLERRLRMQAYIDDQIRRRSQLAEGETCGCTRTEKIPFADMRYCLDCGRPLPHESVQVVG